MTPQNWIPLPDAITEDEISITLTWKASSRNRQALERQARLMQLDSITEYLLDAIASRLSSDEAYTVVRADREALLLLGTLMATTEAPRKV